jgi:hypothetical protein
MIKAFFVFLSSVLNDAEKAMLDLISILVPWAVPIIPAYLTFYHTIEIMGFPVWVGWTAAFVVEALGLVSVATAIRFWTNNKRYKDTSRKAPFALAVSVYTFYIIVVLVVNVILEAVVGTRNPWVITAIALFALLSLPSGILISIRVQYSEMLENRRMTRELPALPAHRERKTRHASAYRQQILEALENEFASTGQVLSPKAISTMLKLDHPRSKGFISTTTTAWTRDRHIRKNPFQI